jgi:hypothetical protein
MSMPPLLLVPLVLAALPLAPPPVAGHRVLVVDWGLHTALVLEQLPGARLTHPGAAQAPFLEVAWGDRSYFAEGKRDPTTVAASLFLPTESAVLLVGHPDPPRLEGAWRVWERRVDTPTLQALLTSLERSLRGGPWGHPAPPLPRPAVGLGRFFPAEGAYWWGRNCNWWLLRRLGDAGLARSAWGVLLPLQVPGRLIGFRPLP